MTSRIYALSENISDVSGTGRYWTGCFRRFAALPERNEFPLSSSYPSQT